MKDRAFVIDIVDDGGGIKKDVVLRKAREKGIVSEDQVLNRRRDFSTYFAPGFSTAAEVSEISGRGVGMDVVRRNIQELNGVINIDSEEGVGTTISISLPLTLAIIDGPMITVAIKNLLFRSFLCEKLLIFAKTVLTRSVKHTNVPSS